MHKFVPIALALPLAACANPGGSEPSAPPVPPEAAPGGISKHRAAQLGAQAAPR